MPSLPVVPRCSSGLTLSARPRASIGGPNVFTNVVGPGGIDMSCDGRAWPPGRQVARRGAATLVTRGKSAHRQRGLDEAAGSEGRRAVFRRAARVGGLVEGE